MDRERAKKRLRMEILGLGMVIKSLSEMLEGYKRQQEAVQAELDEIEFQEIQR